jgi:hypothetical protein
MDYRLRSWALEEDRLTVWDAEDLEADPGYIGLTGSSTVVTDLDEAPYRERRREFLRGSTDEVVRELTAILMKELKFL